MTLPGHGLVRETRFDALCQNLSPGKFGGNLLTAILGPVLRLSLGFLLLGRFGFRFLERMVTTDITVRVLGPEPVLD